MQQLLSDVQAEPLIKALVNEMMHLVTVTYKMFWALRRSFGAAMSASRTDLAETLNCKV